MGQIKVRGKMQRVTVIDDNRVLARNVRYSTVKGNELISYASQSAHIAESNLRAATLAIREAISYFVLNGHHVDLGKFGIFGIRTKTKSALDVEQVDSKMLRRMSIGFTPSKELKEAISTLKIEAVVE